MEILRLCVFKGISEEMQNQEVIGGHFSYSFGVSGDYADPFCSRQLSLNDIIVKFSSYSWS